MMSLGLVPTMLFGFFGVCLVFSAFLIGLSVCNGKRSCCAQSDSCASDR